MAKMAPHAATLALLLCFCCSLSSAGLRSQSRADATEEVLNILRDPAQYDSVVMPVNGTGGPTHCKTQIYFRELDVDDVKMQITVDMTFRMIWKDSRLKFTTPGVPYVSLSEPELAWIPDAFFKKAISTQQQMTVLPQNYLRVHRDGKLIFSTRLIVVFSCPMDFQRFPHDKQECFIRVASYGYPASDLSFAFADEHPVTYNTETMQSLNFVLERVTTDSCTSETSTGVYSCVQVGLKLDRVVSSYLLEFYVPCIFLVIIAAMSEIAIITEFLSRVLLTLVPLITLCMYTSTYALFTTASVAYTRAIDVFSGISLLVIFIQLIRVMVLHHYAQRKIKEEQGELLPRHPRDDCFETLIVNANLISKVLLLAFYLLFLLTYFLAYNI